MLVIMLLPGRPAADSSIGSLLRRWHRPRPPDAGLLLLAWSALAVAITAENGTYWLGGVVLVCAGLLAGYLACAGGVHVPVRVGLVVAVALVLVGGVADGPVNHGLGTWYYLSRAVAVIAALVAAATVRWPRLFVPALTLLALTALLKILATPTPPIDVHFLLTDSTRGLIHGKNLYDQSWPGSHGLQNEYPYLPWTSVLLLPAWLITHEVRVGLLAWIVAGMVALWRLQVGASPNPLQRRHFRPVVLLPLLLLSYPKYAYSIKQSWTEPLLLGLLALMVLAVQRGRLNWAVVLFALALASKQHIVLLLPLAAWWPAFGWRRAAASAGLGFALVLPWLASDPRGLWDDAVLLNLHYPVLQRALDVPSLLDRHGVTLGFGVVAIAVLAAYAVAALRLSRDAAGFAAGGGLVQLALDAFNKQSFFNHYTLAMGLFVIALVAAGARPSVSGGEQVERGQLEDVVVRVDFQ